MGRYELGGCICRGVYRRRPFLRGVLDGAGVVVVVGVFFTVFAVEGGVFGVDEWVTGEEAAAAAAIIGNPVGRDGDVGTVWVPFREEAEVGGRELSTMFSGREEDFARERVLLSRLERVDICHPAVQDRAFPASQRRAQDSNTRKRSRKFSPVLGQEREWGQEVRR